MLQEEISPEEAFGAEIENTLTAVADLGGGSRERSNTITKNYRKSDLNNLFDKQEEKIETSLISS
jgi:hypothetical protein